MASISTDENGNRTIQFVAGDTKRRTIRLGRVSLRLTREIKAKVENLNAALVSGLTVDNETALWVSRLGDGLTAKLAAAGLIPGRESMTVGALVESYVARRIDVKQGTRTNYEISGARLTEFFGRDRNLRDVSPGDADAWLVSLRTKYAPATVGRTVKHARQFFRSAMRHGVIRDNPFAEIKAPGQANTARGFFVTPETAKLVLDACPDAEWRLIVALSRYGGLRCPSEHLRLEWLDVDWERDRFLVRSPKKEHLEDGGERWVPIFPELRPYLEEAFDLAQPGAVHVITRYRNTKQNLRTHFKRIIRRAGLKPWPRLFQNLRASRETELAETYPLHVVCKWIGNTAKVAADHYLQVTEDHFQRAAKSGAVVTENALQNPMQQPPAPSRMYSPETENPLDSQELLLIGSGECESVQDWPVTPTGFEPVSRP